VELRYDSHVAAKLDRLLKSEKNLMTKQYIKAELSTIREAFIARFPVTYKVEK
jgi:hypothetical protein